MLGWFRKYVRKVGVFGVEVEFHPPTEPARPATPSVPFGPPATAVAPATETARRPVHSPAASRPGGSMATDRAAFLERVAEYDGAAARADYARVLDDLIAWSEAQGGLLAFSPKPATNSQAKVEYRFRGRLFWDAWPQRRVPTKFTYEYDFERAYLLAEFAKLSADGRPASPMLPTVAFRDLVSDAARRRLKQLLGEVLARMASPPASQR